MTPIDILFGWFKPWRWLRGGEWTRQTMKSEIGPGPWIRNYKPLSRESLELLIARGDFKRESYGSASTQQVGKDG